MKVICDTREKKGLDFSGIDVVTEVRHEAMSYGDYSAIYEPPNKTPYRSNLYFERKGFSDLYGTLGKGMPRFRKEIERVKADGATMIIAVEGTDQKVFNGYRRSKLAGTQIIRTLDTLWFKHGIPTIFCANRDMMVWRMVNLWETYFKYSKHI